MGFNLKAIKSGMSFTMQQRSQQEESQDHDAKQTSIYRRAKKRMDQKSNPNQLLVDVIL